jgi:hypothetical protein
VLHKKRGDLKDRKHGNGAAGKSWFNLLDSKTLTLKAEKLKELS